MQVVFFSQSRALEWFAPQTKNDVVFARAAQLLDLFFQVVVVLLVPRHQNKSNKVLLRPSTRSTRSRGEGRPAEEKDVVVVVRMEHQQQQQLSSLLDWTPKTGAHSDGRWPGGEADEYYTAVRVLWAEAAPSSSVATLDWARVAGRMGKRALSVMNSSGIQ